VLEITAFGFIAGAVGTFAGWIIGALQSGAEIDRLRKEADEARSREKHLLSALEAEQVAFRRNQKTLDNLVGKIHPARVTPIERPPAELVTRQDGRAACAVIEELGR
jgi:hypothetical protein